MSIQAYMDKYARKVHPAPECALPAADDPMVTTIRVALDARRLGLSHARARELMEQRGAGIEVTEHALPGAA